MVYGEMFKHVFEKLTLYETGEELSQVFPNALGDLWVVPGA